MKDEDIIFCTLSVGKRYTEDYTCKLIKDVLQNTRSRFAITTDFPEVIHEAYPNEPRLLIEYFDRSEHVLRLPIGINKGASDFNFNVRYTALRQCIDVPEKVVIFTDCDNSLPTWYEEHTCNRIEALLSEGLDFHAPRSALKLRDVLNTYNKERLEGNPTPTIFWHKIWAFDLINTPRSEWMDAPVPAEYLLILVNHEDKLKKFYDAWKYMHDWMVALPYTEGTWAEGFEIGIASYVAGYNAYDMGWHAEVINNAMVASGHKAGHPTSGLSDEN